MNKKQAENLLQKAINNPKGSFRQGQWEAIDTIVNKRKKMLLVQRTGWGKSSVYFISTRILRDMDLGPTIIISPLLALMRNQIDAANRLGIKAITINSSNKSEWNTMTQSINNNEVDALLISPERLANDDFINNALMPISDKIGLLVIDEAHCISDWGHDFRPDYQRIVNILKQMPPNMPVICTTATANDRVINDINSQIGDITTSRGSLERKSLVLQTIKFPDQSARLAWLTENLPKIPGTGIVYTLTKTDAKRVALWLNNNNINAAAYFSDVTPPDYKDSNEYRQYLEDALLNNKIKVLVATTALGMGYDKPDLGFVIHYQAPSSIVSYYQQVGRAGRAIDRAVGVLLSGKEDEDIHNYFMRTAFPAEDHVQEILTILENSDGLNKRELEKHSNLSFSQIEKVLKYLRVEASAPVIFEDSKWKRVPIPYKLDSEKIARLNNQRKEEWKEILNYIDTKKCHMVFLKNALNDDDLRPCGKCANCLESDVIPKAFNHEIGLAASAFLRKSEIIFNPKKQFPNDALINYGLKGNIPDELRTQEGRILSRWGDAGWGHMVAKDKHQNHFRDELIEAMVEMITKRWKPEPFPIWLTWIPSLRHKELVPDLAQRIADKLKIKPVEALEKILNNEPQKNQNNRFHQCKNLDDAFKIKGNIPNEPVLLIDDIIDSGWTMTINSVLLLQKKSGPVFPAALASTTLGS